MIRPVSSRALTELQSEHGDDTNWYRNVQSFVTVQNNRKQKPSAVACRETNAEENLIPHLVGRLRNNTQYSRLAARVSHVELRHIDLYKEKEVVATSLEKADHNDLL